MKALILKYWDRIQSSFWFVPAIMSGCAVVLAISTVALDRAVTDEWLQSQKWAYTGGAQGASLVLSTIAGSMITIAGVVFSMTLVALSLASSQLGPRLLRNFMRDAVNQTVLGTFVATFIYCLLVLRTIRHADETLFVPHLSVTLGVLLALVSIGVVIYFIHHVSVSIQADEVVARIGEELVEEIDRLFPELLENAKLPAALKWAVPENVGQNSRPVLAASDGYLQRIDTERLIALAAEEDGLFCLERRPGNYVVAGTPLLSASPIDRVTDELADKINGAFVIGRQRTSLEDVEFPVQQLVEIALRALSPGINDPFTAIACVDRLGSALCRLAQRAPSSSALFDENGRLRVIVRPATFEGLFDAAFTQLRQHSRSNASVMVHILETIVVIAAVTREGSYRKVLLRHAAMINRAAQEAFPESEDCLKADAIYHAARLELESG